MVISQNTFSEVYEILSYMDKATVMKIPTEILINIKNRRNINYKSKINPEDIFNKNNISEDTINILAWLDVNYWIDKEKKKQLIKNYYSKTKTYNMFENKKPTQSINVTGIISNNNRDLIKNEKTNNFFRRVINFIKSVLKKR